MLEPEERKVTATGGGLHASRLLKLGGVRRSLLKKGLFVRFTITTTLKSSLPALIFKQPSQHSNSQLAHTFVLQLVWSTLHVSLREASLRMRMSSVTITLAVVSYGKRIPLQEHVATAVA